MAIKITLKNSVVENSVPTTTHLPTVGELAVNANANSPAGYMRLSDNTIAQIFGPGSITTPAASTTVAGISEYATNAETTTGSSTTRSVTPAGLAAVTSAERTTSNSTYLALAGGTLTNPLVLPNASNSAPALTGADTDSGVYFATNSVSLAAGGVQGLTLNSDAYVNVPTRLGVGVASPAVAFHINSGATNECARFESSDTEVTLELKDTTGTATIKSRNDFRFGNSTGELARVDDSGRLLVGLTSARTLLSGNIPSFQVEGTANSDSSLSIVENASSTNGPSLLLGKTRGTALGGTTIVQTGDELGTIYFNGSDGTDIQSTGAFIRAKASGTIAGNRMPGQLLFATTADSAGSVTPTAVLTLDSIEAKFAGDIKINDDLKISHDGTNKIDAASGALDIRTSTAADIDILTNDGLAIKCVADGSTNLYYDGSPKLSTTSTGVKVEDNQMFVAGEHNDLSIYHDGTKNYLKSIASTNTEIWSDTFYVKSVTGSGEAIIKGSVNGAAELYYDNTKRVETTSWGLNVLGNCGVGNNNSFQCGDNQDLQIFHTSGDSKIKNNTGWFVQAADSYAFKTNDETDWFMALSSSAVKLYYDGAPKLETKNYGVTATGHFELDGANLFKGPDNAKLNLGNSNDLKVYHSSTDDNSYIWNDTGDLRIFSGSNSDPTTESINCKANGHTSLYYDGAEKAFTHANGFKLNDDKILLIGTGNDLKLSHNGTVENSYIQNDTGYLYIDTVDNVYIRSDSGVDTAVFDHTNGCSLKYQGNTKLNTTNVGVTVTGAVTESSDLALKSNIEPLTNVLDKINQITGYKYNFTSNNSSSMGVIAQDVEKVFPELVHGEEGSKSLQYSGLIGVLVESVKELSAKVAALEGA